MCKECNAACSRDLGHDAGYTEQSVDIDIDIDIEDLFTVEYYKPFNISSVAVCGVMNLDPLDL